MRLHPGDSIRLFRERRHLMRRPREDRGGLRTRR